MKIIGHIADAATTLVMLIVTVAGADLRIIVSIMLLMMFVSELAKAFNAYAEPVKEALDRLKESRQSPAVEQGVKQ